MHRNVTLQTANQQFRYSIKNGFKCQKIVALHHLTKKQGVAKFILQWISQDKG